MGKKDFSQMYQLVKSQLAREKKELTIKISHFSDVFDETKDFAGVIIYHWEGKVQWHNQKINHRGRSFYVYLVCTNNFRDEEFREAGQGRVHHTAVEKIMGMDFRENKACLGGFSVKNGVTEYSSMWLNTKSNSSYSMPWESDDSKYLSEAEKVLVDLTVAEWKAKGPRGPNTVVQIPPETDHKLCSGFFGSSTPTSSSHGSALCCPEGDPLCDLGFAEDDGWVCDDCRKSGAGMHCWGCETCGYSLCSGCYAYKVQKPEPSAKKAPALQKLQAAPPEVSDDEFVLWRLRLLPLAERVKIGEPFRLQSLVKDKDTQKELFLQVEGWCPDDGAGVELWERLEGTGQHWFYHQPTQTIHNRRSGKGLDACGKGYENGTRIHMWHIDSQSLGSNQQWRIVHGLGDLVKLVGVASEKPIQVAMEHSAFKGVHVHLWDDAEVPQAWWRLQLVRP